jgi:hypothetical protein
MVECQKRLMGQSTVTPWFRTIPPERVGLFGEYDHHGLAKRVSLAFSQNFEPCEIEKLRIRQRGAVVVLIGEIQSQWLLIKMVKLAMSTSGTADVEVNGVVVGDHLRHYLEVKPSHISLQHVLRAVKRPRS